MDKRLKTGFLLLCMMAMMGGFSRAEEKGRLHKIWKLRIADILPLSRGRIPADIVVFGLGFSRNGVIGHRESSC